MSRAENRIKKFQNSVFQIKPENDMCTKNDGTFWNRNDIFKHEQKLALKSGRKKIK